MSERSYELKEILDALFIQKEHQLKKRWVYNHGIFGGLQSKWLKLSLLALPFVMYAAIFNDFSFEKLGIAQAIVFYIILLVFAMQIVMAAIYWNNKKVLQKAAKAWERYFPEVDLKMVLASGVTPYADFGKYYAEAAQKGLEGDALVKQLQQDFATMEENNQMLVEAMRRDKAKKEKA